MTYVMVDIEADGPIPGKYSMISLGAVVVEEGLKRTFYREIKPISDLWVPEALTVSRFSREDTLSFLEPTQAMLEWEEWLQKCNLKGRPMFISDNNGFDWMFVCWYFQTFLGRNPFGFSSTNLGSLYKGLVRNTRKNFKHYRPRGSHTHNALDDAKGNAVAQLRIFKEFGLKL